MANTSRGFTPRRPEETPSNRKFSFKKSGTRPFASEISDVTPFLSTDTVGHLSTENPCNSKSSSFDSASFENDYEVTRTEFTRPRTSSGHVRAQPDESEGLGKHFKNIPLRTPHTAHRGNEVSGFDKETPFIYATAKRKISSSTDSERKSSSSSRNSELHGDPLSSSYFLKPSTSSVLKPKKKRQNQPRQGAASSVITGSQSAWSDVEGSVAMETETEGDMSVEDVGHLRTVERSENSTDSQVYMGVAWQSGRLSVAYYDIDLTVVYMMLDSAESDEFKLLHRVIKQVGPTQVILSSKQDERLIKTLKSYASDSSISDDSAQGPFQLHFLPSIDFALEICKRRVLSLQLPSVPAHYTDTERTLYFNSLVPFENVCMVRAVGGLLKYLEKMRVGIELEEAGVRVPVLGLKVFTLDDQMILDETAYSALQIFQRESHPSAYKAGTSNSGKEGLSLFGIMNKTKSQIGSRLLRTWFQRPLKNLEVLKQRHDAVAYFVNPRNIEVVKTLEDSVRYVKNIAKILTRMMQSQASVGDWHALYKTGLNACNIKEVCRVQPQSIEIFRKITETFSDKIHSVTTVITKIVDFPESLRNGRFVVQPKVDCDLDKKKRTFAGLPDLLTKVADTELERLDGITECSVIYMPQIGYLLSIPESAINIPLTAENSYYIEGLEFLGTIVFELNTKFGDIRNDITDIETNIMHKLQDTVLQHTNVLIAVLDYTAELDCLLSLAACAREYDYVRPTLTLSNVIEVTGGRHAIQEMCCSTFVPNDILSNGEYGKIKVLTGPNACGKSVYLKQVAVIVFLAQVGSFVPAEKATLGLMDRIFTRVRSLESVSTGLSTFMIDINQMAEALRSSTDRSLCIIDEFGKGTDMIDGLSLLSSCLSYWVYQDTCPHVFVSTHFHSIIHQHLLPKSPIIKYLTLETLNNGEELVFLYQVTEGHTSSSYACHIAAQVGLPLDVVKRGIEVSELIRQCKPVQRADTVGIESQSKRCSTVVNRFLELDLETADIKSFFDELVLTTVEIEQ